MYKKARSGEIKNFTGISAPYEEPENPDLVIDTNACTVEDAVNKLESFLVEKGTIPQTISV